MAIKTTIKALLDKHAKEIISELPGSFDSHEFIQRLIKKDEEGYVRELHGCIKSKNGIFRNFHSRIGQYLSKNRETIGIRSTGKVSSENIKDYISNNEGWKK